LVLSQANVRRIKADGETAMAESNSPTEDGPVATDPHAVAAE
jgi:hypothetical protein